MDKKALLAAAAALAATVSLSQQALAAPVSTEVVPVNASTQVTLDAHGRPVVDGKFLAVSKGHSSASRMKLADNSGCNSGCGHSNLA